jgi:hypothetical protein
VIAPALLLAIRIASDAGGVRTFEEVLHVGEHLDLDTGLVSNREAFAHARADLHFAGAETGLLWRSGAGRAGSVSEDTPLEEVLEVAPRPEADSPPVPLEPGSVVLFRTSEGVGGKLRLLAVDWRLPQPGERSGEEAGTRGANGVRLEWVLADGPTRFSPGPAGARARTVPRGIEVSWEEGSRCRVERVDEDTGARAILAREALPPLLDADAREGGFFRYEISRRLAGEALSDRARIYAVRAEGGLRGEFLVSGSAPRIDLARGSVDGPRHDLSVLAVTPGGMHFSPAPGGAILPLSAEGRAPAERQWISESAAFVGVGGTVLVRTRDGRRARVRVLEILREEAKGIGARLAFEFLPDYGRAFVEPPGNLEVSFEGGRVRLRWTHPEAGAGLFRVEREHRGGFEAVAEVEGTSYEEPAGERLFAAFRVVRRDARGRESLPSGIASLAVFERGGAGPFADRATASLGSPDHARREEAERALRAMGAAARDALRRAASSEDPEVAERAGEILREIGSPGEPGGEVGAEALAERFGRAEADRSGLLDPERRLLALLSDSLGAEDRVFLGERDPDPFLRRVAKSPRFGPASSVGEPPYAEASREPYAFDRAAAGRLFGSGRSGAEVAADLVRSLPRRPVRDAWLLRTVVDGMRDPALSEERRERAEVALRCLHGRPPGDVASLGAAEAVLGEAFALERARAMRAVACGAFALREDGGGEPVEVESLLLLQEAVDRAEPGTRILLRRGEYGGGPGVTLTIRRGGVRLSAAEEGIVLAVPVRLEGADEVRIEGLAVSPAGPALHALRSSLVAERCTFGPAMVGAVADRSELCFRDCRFEASSGNAGYGIQVQRGSFLVLEGCLLRGFSTGIYLAAPALVERTVFSGPPGAQAAVQGSTDAYLGLVRCAVRGSRNALRTLPAGFAAGIALDRVASPFEGLGTSFLLCSEDLSPAAGSGVVKTDAAAFSDCEAAIRPR